MMMTPTLKDLITKSIFATEQEMVLTLPQRLLTAFRLKLHQKYKDPQTDKPFTSFYRWLMTSPPPGCGLAGSYMDAGVIIYQMQKSRERMPEEKRGLVNALIEELIKGFGAARPAGRPKKRQDKIGAVPHQLNGKGRHGSNRVDTLAARLAESTDPKIRKEWKAFLEGKHGSVTRAAIAAGMIEDANAPIKRLKQNWFRASATERREFLKFINARFICDDDAVKA
jgi:hypothetical protein